MAGKIPTMINVLLLILLIGGSMAVWDTLPERFPAHFGIDGKADSWGPKSIVTWFMLPGLTTALTLLMYGIAAFTVRHPEFINMPDKKRFLELPPEWKEKVYAVLKGMLYWIAVMLNVLFILIQLGSYQAANGRAMPGLILSGVLLSIIVSPMIAITGLLRIQSVMNAAARN